MWDTPGRLLRVLELLQRRQDWGAAELAERLGVSNRTVRRDVDRLRSIGYPVQARPGVDGGYRLAPGTSLPPLMFDAEEAIATVLALQVSSVSGAEVVSGSTLRALTKLTAVMPRRLRRQVDALSSQVSHTPHGAVIGQAAAMVDPAMLITAAMGCREQRRLAARSGSADDAGTDRTLEPFRLVRAGNHWYLVAWDLSCHDWRTFRMDDFIEVALIDHPTANRPPPSGDIEAYVLAHIGAGIQQHRATVHVQASRAAVQRWIDPAWGRIEEISDAECVLHVGSDSFSSIARWLLLLDADLTVIEPPALADEFAAVARRAARAATTSPPYRKPVGEPG